MQSKAILFLIWIVATMSFAFAGSAILNVDTYYLLTTRGIQTEGVVTDTDPQNHRTVHYSYTVNQQSYSYGGFSGDINRRFEDIKPGDKVPVVYDSLRPDVSTLGDPSDQLRPLINGTVFISLFPTIFLIAYAMRNKKRK